MHYKTDHLLNRNGVLQPSFFQLIKQLEVLQYFQLVHLLSILSCKFLYEACVFHFKLCILIPFPLLIEWVVHIELVNHLLPKKLIGRKQLPRLLLLPLLVLHTKCNIYLLLIPRMALPYIYRRRIRVLTANASIRASVALSCVCINKLERDLFVHHVVRFIIVLKQHYLSVRPI